MIDLRTPVPSSASRRASRLPDPVRRFGPAIASLAVQLPLALAVIAAYGPGAADALVGILLAVAGPIALLGARRRPGPTVAVVAALALVHGLTSPVAWVPYVALWFAIGIGVAHGALVWTAVSAGTAWLGEVVLGTLEGLEWHPLRVAVETAVLAACFGIGWLVWVRRGHAAALREEVQLRRRRAERRERARIAGGLHDELGQALSQAHVEATVALHALDRDPVRARVALERIRATTNAALTDLRVVVDAIRDGDEVPWAELDELTRLVEAARSRGVRADLDNRLGRAPSRAVQYAAYRIVEEAIDNAVRHASADGLDVVLDRDDRDLVLTVDDDGDGIGERAQAGGGIVGMRDRAALIGGRVEVGPSPAGGTRVTARLPWSDVA
ncbi:sensor histidine kinase [Agromyces sp. MMS24-JH15]|uniref:sensor histidine kinase n=1 Tax=Agromyces sp. MMS24-JH15 TaxID=3243765 RepID=UPI0037480F56